jgi:hypothetical protein
MVGDGDAVGVPAQIAQDLRRNSARVASGRSRPPGRASFSSGLPHLRQAGSFELGRSDQFELGTTFYRETRCADRLIRSSFRESHMGAPGPVCRHARHGEGGPPWVTLPRNGMIPSAASLGSR